MNARFLFLPLLAAAALQAQTPPQQAVSVVAVGSIPRSVVKWHEDGRNEYVLAEPKALPPANLFVRASAEEGAKFEPLTLTLNIPSKPVPAPAAGLPLFQGAQGAPPAAEAAPLLVVPVVAGVSRQLVMMYRKSPADDWGKPEFFPVNLTDSRFPAGSVAFVNLSGQTVKVELPQTKAAMNLGHRKFVSAKAPANGAALNYRISAQGPGGKLQPVAFTGLRANAGQRQVVAVFLSNDRKTVCSSFVVSGE